MLFRDTFHSLSAFQTLYVKFGEELLGNGTVRPLNPFDKSIVRLVCNRKLPAGNAVEATVLLDSSDLPTERFTMKERLPRR